MLHEAQQTHKQAIFHEFFWNKWLQDMENVSIICNVCHFLFAMIVHAWIWQAAKVCFKIMFQNPEYITSKAVKIKLFASKQVHLLTYVVVRH